MNMNRGMGRGMGLIEVRTNASESSALDGHWWLPFEPSFSSSSF